MPIRILIITMLFSWGCSSTPKVKEEEKKVSETSIEEKVVPPADLKQCPCGRSDWDKLPPGHEKAPK